MLGFFPVNAAVLSMNASDSRNAAATMCSALLFLFNASFALNEVSLSAR
jgi:hypothetical protein